MSLWEREELVIVFDDKPFIITKLEVDISAEFGKPEGTVSMSHKIEGFEVPLYLVADLSDSSFSFGYRVTDGEGDNVAGLFVALQDEELFNKALEVVEFIDKVDKNGEA